MVLMQNEIIAPIPLLDQNGMLTKEGWAREPFWQYDRKAIKASSFRIKEWDYYSILSHDKQFGITLTMSDLGYAGLFAICWLDFAKRTYQQIDTLSILPLGKTGFSPDSNTGYVRFTDQKLSLDFSYEKGNRVLKFAAPDLTDSNGQKGLIGEIILQQPDKLESINIATSWPENRRAFYYNRKINCMPASGQVLIGSNAYVFESNKDFGALDWGRGRWTYKNRWYWGSGSGYVDGQPFGFNIGYGFTDRTPASENTIFFAGRAHKFEDILFHIDTQDYMKPWRFTSSDGRFEMDFKPLVDRQSAINLLLIRSVQHQVFGHFTGQAILDDGRVIKIKDFLGFAEDVLNFW